MSAEIKQGEKISTKAMQGGGNVQSPGFFGSNLPSWSHLKSPGSPETTRASKSCRRADARLLKVIQNMRHVFFTFERESGENCPNFVFLAQSDKVFYLSYVFLWHSQCMSLGKILF